MDSIESVYDFFFIPNKSGRSIADEKVKVAIKVDKPDVIKGEFDDAVRKGRFHYHTKNVYMSTFLLNCYSYCFFFAGFLSDTMLNENLIQYIEYGNLDASNDKVRALVTSQYGYIIKTKVGDMTDTLVLGNIKSWIQDRREFNVDFHLSSIRDWVRYESQ